MLNNLANRNNVIAMVLAGGMSALTVLNAIPANAGSLNAGFVLNEMNNDQRQSYIAGVIEGIAYSRFLKERPNETGMNCIYNWYYDGTAKKIKLVRAWFSRHLDKPVGPLLYVLIKKECGA